MKRREFLLASSTLILNGLTPPYGPILFNPCESGLPTRLSQHEVVLSGLEDLDPSQLWDGHVHLIGTGDSKSGVWINPHMRNMLHIRQFAQLKFYLNASCTVNNQIDESYVKRLLELHKEMPSGSRLLLLAFDYTYNKQGKRQKKFSAFHTPNEYATKIAAVNPKQFEWVASIYPYRIDGVEALYKAKQSGARAVKWLPPAMGIDPSSPLCDNFYLAMKECDLPLIVHAGEEKAVHGANMHEFGNPLLLRRPLEQGVKVIVAHCASLGSSIDLDKSDKAKKIANFELFQRLRGETKYEENLFGEIYAMTQINRVGPALDMIIQRQDWHHRLINASDYPLPAVMPLFSLGKLVKHKYISETQALVLGEVRKYNALLFDLLLKRLLRVKGLGLQNIVFASRRVFDQSYTI